MSRSNATPYGRNSSDSKLRAPALQAEDEVDCLPVERVVAGWLGDAEMGLEGDVAEVFEDENAQVVGVASDGRHGQRNTLKQAPDVYEG